MPRNNVAVYQSLQIWGITFNHLYSHYCRGLRIDRCEEVSIQFCDEKCTQQGLRPLPLCFSLFPDWLDHLQSTVCPSPSLGWMDPMRAVCPFDNLCLQPSLTLFFSCPHWVRTPKGKAHPSIAMCQFLCVLKLSWNWLLRFHLVDNLVSPLSGIFVGNFFQSVSHLV